MAAIGRAGIVVVILAALSMFSLHKDHNDSTPEGVPSKARILDLSYAINDKLVPWPGDEKFFEAKVNATIEKNGYFTRSFRSEEHTSELQSQSNLVCRLLLEKKLTAT